MRARLGRIPRAAKAALAAVGGLPLRVHRAVAVAEQAKAAGDVVELDEARRRLARGHARDVKRRGLELRQRAQRREIERQASAAELVQQGEAPRKLHERHVRNFRTDRHVAVFGRLAHEVEIDREVLVADRLRLRCGVAERDYAEDQTASRRLHHGGAVGDSVSATADIEAVRVAVNRADVFELRVLHAKRAELAVNVGQVEVDRARGGLHVRAAVDEAFDENLGAAPLGIVGELADEDAASLEFAAVLAEEVADVVVDGAEDGARDLDARDDRCVGGVGRSRRGGVGRLRRADGNGRGRRRGRGRGQRRAGCGVHPTVVFAQERAELVDDVRRHCALAIDAAKQADVSERERSEHDNDDRKDRFGEPEARRRRELRAGVDNGGEGESESCSGDNKRGQAEREANR